MGKAVLEDDFPICSKFKVKDGCCEECGEKLQTHIDKVEYWGAIVNMSTRYCPKCD